MRILILGGNGMLSHQLFKYFSSKHEVFVTLRQDFAHYEKCGLYNNKNAFPNIDICSSESILGVLSAFQPEVVINGIGLTFKGPKPDIESSIEVNALFPHKMARYCKDINAKFIQISTDCVFSGDGGMYSEKDLPDANDIYGRTKYLGEVHDDHCITIRTSIVGLEICHKKHLIEWFLSQSGVVNGYQNAIFSGITTIELSRVLNHVLTEFPDMSGVWQVVSDPISKFELLKRINQKLHSKNAEVVPFDDFRCNRSLIGTRFFEYTGYVIPSWEDMIIELVNEINEREG